jgi:hypothetical protein
MCERQKDYAVTSNVTLDLTFHAPLLHLFRACSSGTAPALDLLALPRCLAAVQ